MTTDKVLRAKQVKALKAFYRDGQKQFEVWLVGVNMQLSHLTLCPILNFAEA
jgi:hypothetical protein